MTKVSIVIPCFNAERWITETIESALSQELPDVEIVVIDDGSTDGSVDLIKRISPAINLICTENQGPSRARNLGTSVCNGELIQYLDADDILAPGKIKAQLRALAASNADVAYGDWQRLVPSAGGGYSPGEIVSRRLDDPEIDLFTDFWCPPAAYLFTRTIVEKTGGWSESLPIIQDARFALDCALHGGGFVYCPGVMASYRMHGSGSVSTGDLVAFGRDVLSNAKEVEGWWSENGGIDQRRKAALLRVYAHVARGSYESDRETFWDAYSRLERISPGYVPEGPAKIALASRLVGYPRAEGMALVYRKLKSALRLG